MPKLDLNDSPRTLVYRKLVELVRIDPTIKRVISRPASFRAWDGAPEDSQPFTVDIAPAVRFTPINGPDLWQYPSAFAGDLYINVEMLVWGSDVSDVFNLWWAIERAIYPRDFAAKTAIVSALQQAGARTGLAEFSQPAFDPEPKDNFFAATGQIKIAVLEQLQP